MTEPKWTPGPWENQGEDLFADVPFIRIGDGYRSTSICEVLPPIDAEEPDEETCANANLIAAAPDLYVAAKESRTLLNVFIGPDDTLGQSILTMLDNAMRKARGE